MSLVGTLVGFSLAAILAVFLGRMMTATQRATRSIAMSGEMTTVVASVNALLGHADSCKKTFGSLSFPGGPQTLSLVNAAGQPIVAAGMDFSGLKIDTVTADPGTSTDGSYLVTLSITAKKTGDKAQTTFGGRPTLQETFRVLVATNAGVVVGCIPSGQGGNIALMNVARDFIRPAPSPQNQMILVPDLGTQASLAPAVTTANAHFVLTNPAIWHTFLTAAAIRAKGNVWKLNVQADMAVASAMTTPQSCLWMGLEIKDVTDGVTVFTPQQKTIGYSCLSEVSVFKAMMIEGIVVGHDYTIRPAMLRATANGLNPPPSVFAREASSGVEIVFEEYLRSTP